MFKSLSRRREYLKEWRLQHPHYSMWWNRLNRAGKKTMGLAERLRLHTTVKGRCSKCSILLTSLHAFGHNGVKCGRCLKIDEKRTGIKNSLPIL